MSHALRTTVQQPYPTVVTRVRGALDAHRLIGALNSFTDTTDADL